MSLTLPRYKTPRVPKGPHAIEKGTPVKDVLNETAIAYLARNIAIVEPAFSANAFRGQANDGLEPLSVMARGKHIAKALFDHLPVPYSRSIEILIASMAEEADDSESFGLSSMFYLPYSAFIADYGLSPEYNVGEDPFEISMHAQLELTKRFTAEFSIRPFLIEHQDRTLEKIHSWLSHESMHVRRLCSEGTRPKLPWGINLPAFIKDPVPILPILETLKNDEALYVRRSVANSLGDIAKDHAELVFELCESWLADANNELRWVIRHAVRYHAKKKHPAALALREKAKAVK